MQIPQRTNWLQSGRRVVAHVLRQAALTCCAIMVFSSCEQDTYDKGDGYFSDTQATFCEAHSNSGNAIDYVVTDEGEHLQLTTPFTSKAITTPDSIYRMAIFYNKVEQNKAEPVSLALVPTMGIADAGEFENLATDPLKLESVWLSKSGKYVNLALWLKVGEAGENVERQSLGMVRMDNRANADGTTTAVIRLHHSQGDIPQYYSQKYYVSLPTSLVEADSICLMVNTYGGEMEKRLRIKNN